VDSSLSYFINCYASRFEAFTFPFSMQMYQRKTDELSLAAVMVLMISVKVSLFVGVDEFTLVVSYESFCYFIFFKL
jgi:hypothetical protein